MSALSVNLSTVEQVIREQFPITLADIMAAINSGGAHARPEDWRNWYLAYQQSFLERVESALRNG